MASSSSAPAGAVCDDKGVCTLPPRAGGSDGMEGMLPLPRTLRPLGVLEDEAGNKLEPAGVFKNKVTARAHIPVCIPTIINMILIFISILRFYRTHLGVSHRWRLGVTSTWLWWCNKSKREMNNCLSHPHRGYPIRCLDDK